VRRVLGLAGWLLAASGLLAGGVYAYLRRSLPRLQGTIEARGLRQPVEIIRDTDGVPHIYAQSKRDVLFGLGYVHAQDRLWEMEIWRRITQGRFAELFGEIAVGGDRFLRALGLQRAAKSVWPTLPEKTQQEIEAYIAGINAVVQARRFGELPPEFAILGLTPEPWTVTDAIAWGKIFALDLASNGSSELFADELVRIVGAERMQQLMPGYPAGKISIVDRRGFGADYAGLIEAQRRLVQLVGVGGPHGGAKGSNAWVVDGTKSATGKPVLANDPHLTMALPGWYQAHLSAGDFDVAGATIPGIPIVAIGRNQHIAWGFTGLGVDVEDFFRERLDPSGRFAEFRGQWEPIEIITETIKVKNRPDIRQEIRITRHGPLMSDVFNAGDQNLPARVRPTMPLEPLAMRWVGIEPGDTSALAFMNLNEARSWDEFTDALRHLVAPALNVLYADVEGNIGYHAAGKIPVRASDGVSMVPVEGWTGEHEWVGWVPFEALPLAYNPPEHLIVTANNRPIPDDYPYFLGREWYPHYRAERIHELLGAHERLTIADHMAIQNDTVSLQARELLPHLLPLLAPRDDLERRAAELLKGWNYDTRGDSAAAAIYEAWLIMLLREAVEDELGSERNMLRYAENYTFTSRFLADLFVRPPSNSGASAATPDQAERATIARQAFRRALALLKFRLGGDPAHWRWDRLHRAKIFHVPFEDVPILKKIFSRSVPRGGDWSTVNMGAYGGPFRPIQDRAMDDFEQRFGPSYRTIIDLSRLEGACFIETVGQCGHFLSRHYDDYLEDWVSGRYRPVRRQRATIEQHQEGALRLVP
jgi:penicillin G amidase